MCAVKEVSRGKVSEGLESLWLCSKITAFINILNV